MKDFLLPIGLFMAFFLVVGFVIGISSTVKPPDKAKIEQNIKKSVKNENKRKDDDDIYIGPSIPGVTIPIGNGIGIF